MSQVFPFKGNYQEKIAFQRPEMRHILDVYGRLVATGQAKDYAIGMYKDRAIFAIYRRASEAPNWRIEKIPSLANKQGAYCVVGSSGQVLKRGRDLRAVLNVFARKRFDVVG